MNGLYEKLNENNVLTLQRESGEILKVSCELNKPATDNEIASFIKKTNYNLPNDFKAFLKLHNGAKLFSDGIDYLEIFSLEQMEKYHQEYKTNKNYQGAYNDTWFMIAYYKGYGDYIFIDSEKASKENNDYLIYNQMGDLLSLDLNFETWIDRFIVSQGSRYWLW